MSAAVSLIDRARREQHEQLELGLFAHLLERMPAVMRPGQVAKATGWSLTTVYELCAAPCEADEPIMLEAHELPGRKRQDKRITRRSVAAMLLRTAKYQPADFPALLALTLPTMPLAQLKSFQTAVAAQIARVSL